MTVLERRYMADPRQQAPSIPAYTFRQSTPAPRSPRVESNPCVEYDGLVVDPVKRLAVVDGRSIHLTKTECALLAHLALSGGRVVTDEQLLYRVWGAAYIDCGDYLHVYMHRLRRKLDRPDHPSMIVTEHRIGYRLCIPTASQGE